MTRFTLALGFRFCIATAVAAMDKTPNNATSLADVDEHLRTIMRYVEVVGKPYPLFTCHGELCMCSGDNCAEIKNSDVSIQCRPHNALLTKAEECNAYNLPPQLMMHDVLIKVEDCDNNYSQCPIYYVVAESDTNKLITVAVIGFIGCFILFTRF